MSKNLAETRLSLDGYRIQILEKLKSFSDPAQARSLLAEVDVALKATDLSPRAQRAFWEALHTDLDVIAEDSPAILGKHMAAQWSAIIALANTEIRHYLNLISA